MKSQTILVILFFFTAISLSAQTAIYPKSKAFVFSKFQPFQAEYTQMQYSLKVMCSLSPDKSVYNIVMIMPDGLDINHVLTDVIGIDAKTGDFLYRNFSLLYPVKMNFNVKRKKDHLMVQKMTSQGSSLDSISLDERGVFDGTFAFWLMRGMDYNKNPSFKMNTWKTGQKGIEANLSSEVRFKEKVDLKIGGQTFICDQLIQSSSQGVKIISYISKEAPYLIKQEYVKGDEAPVTILEFKSLF